VQGSSNITNMRALDSSNVSTAINEGMASRQGVTTASQYALQQVKNDAYARGTDVFAAQNATSAAEQASTDATSSAFQTLESMSATGVDRSEAITSNSVVFDQLEQVATNHYLVEVSWDAVQAAQQQASSQAQAAGTSSYGSAFDPWGIGI